MERQMVIQGYQDFFETHQDLNISFYGLIPLGEKGASRFHDQPYKDSLELNFPFDKACVWEDMDHDEAELAMEVVGNGNITIAKEGCETYWILIVSGKLIGQIWLLTECGVTPVEPDLTLMGWKELQLASDNQFWYDLVKDWGPFKYSFFYGHAAKKMVTAGETVFGTNTSLCKDCLKFISKAAVYEKEEIVVTDNEGTRVFEITGKIISI